MAAPIAHIFCALALLQQGKIKVVDKQSFILGTSFPDIRYLGVIKRDQTHEKNVNWNDVINAPTSFEAGRLLHVLLDLVREDYVQTHNLYDQFPNTPYRTHILKFFEDTLLHNKINNWQEIVCYFNTILPEEQTYNIHDRYIRIWHQLLQHYIKQPPDAKQIAWFLKQRATAIARDESNIFKRFFKNLINTIKNKAIAFKLNGIMKELEKNDIVRSEMLHFYEHITDFLIQR